MRIIGLTGSIACGKSTVSAELSAQGFPVIDGDLLSRQLTLPGSPLLSQIQDIFGDQYILQDGSLDRAALGSLIFSDENARQTLDNLMAPYLEDLTVRRLAEARRSGAKLCFLSMPLLFEKGYQRFCDTVWCVWLPAGIQLERLMKRNGYSREEALARMGAVMSSDEKAALSDVIIDNSGSPEAVLSLLPSLLSSEMAKIPQRRRRSETPPAAEPSASPSAVSGSTMQSSEPPPVLVRPESARKKPSVRRASWRIPSWLLIILISVASVLAVSFTAQCLMSAYLTRCRAKHLAEERAIDSNYPLSYEETIRMYAAEFNLHPAFVSSIIRNESSFDVKAVSAVGARGLMQLMPDTAEWIAHKLNVEQYAFERMYDADSNIRFGCWYLNYLSRLFHGDPVCVTCAYHAGQGEITSWLSDSSISPDGRTLSLENLPEGPTKLYARKVTRDYGIYQKKYFSDSPVASDTSAVSADS